MTQTSSSIGYSLWFIPDEPEATQCTNLIHDLAPKHNGVLFPPHITLVPDIFPPTSVSTNEVEVRCEKIINAVLPSSTSFTIPFICAATGTVYYRCVYALCEKVPIIMELNKQLQQEFGYNNDYMPHLSFLYSDISNEEREKICTEIQPKVKDIQKVKIKAIELWDTTGRPPVWKCLKTWKLV